MMNTELQRIQATLGQLPKPQTATQTANQHKPDSLPLSFKLDNMPDTQSQAQQPSLPKLKSLQISSHSHGANPALAMSLLKDIEVIVAGWQQELQKIVRQIQDLYLEGPIVDGWLESPHTAAPEVNAGVSKAVRDKLMNYIEELTDGKVTYQSPQPGYRLCGLDEEGKPWSKPCPPEQVPDIGIAIARYQKLRQLLKRKQDLESRLGNLAETLVLMHSNLQGQQ